MSVFFRGRRLVTPVSASAVDDSKMFNRNISVGNVLAIVGAADGGKPLTALRFGSASEARDMLRGNANTIKAIEKAFDPSAETGGASEIVFVRVNPATQAALVLLDGTSNPAINLASTDYGRWTNGITVKIETGTVSGKKLTTQIGTAYLSADNIGRSPLNVAYTGAGASATVSMTGTQCILKVASVVVATIELVDFRNVQQLVDRINAVPSFVANVLGGYGEALTLNGLDYLTDVDCKTAPATVTANLQAVIDWFNSAAETYVTATRANGAGAAPANLPFTYLAGASDGVTTNAQWQSAYDVLQNEDVQWVVPLSSSSAIAAMNDTHVAFMSTVSLKERRGVVGTDVGTTDAQALTAALSLNSDRTSLVHLGIYDYDASGDLVLYPPFVLAALVAGMFAGASPGQALTNKAIKIGGLERQLRNPTDTDILIDGGVLCIEKAKDGYKVVKSISTWLTNDNYNRVEVSVGVACDFVVRNVREAVDPIRGKGGTPLVLAEALSRARTRLDELARPYPGGPGVLVGDATNPPYRNLTVSLDGDVVRVEYECSPVIPVNYVLQVAHAVPYSGSVSI